MSIVCLGEALVDLVRVRGGRGPELFEAHSGGALANVAVAIARAGAPASVAGGVGDDDFGRLLRRTLEAEGVDVGHQRVVPGLATPFAFVRADAGGEPHFQIHGAGIEAGIGSLAGREAQLLAGAEALVVGSNSLAEPVARRVTLDVLERAEGAGLPVLFDPNLRPGRWSELAEAVDLCRGILSRSLLVKASLAEARLLADDPSLEGAAAARAVQRLGPAVAVVTDGPRPAFVAGGAQAQAQPPVVSSPQPIGAGDALMGTLAAGLHARGWAAEAVGETLPAAVAAAAAACELTGAID